MANCKVLGDFLHILKVEERIEASFVIQPNVVVREDSRSVPSRCPTHGDMDHAMHGLHILLLNIEVWKEASDSLLLLHQRFHLCKVSILELC